MEQKVLFDQKLFPLHTPLVGGANRGLRFGDGLFETIKVRDGALLFGSLHFARLWTGLRILRFSLPARFTPATLETDILDLCLRNGHLGSGRVRVNMFRGDGGVNDLISTQPHCLIETFPLDRAFTPANSPGMDIGVFPHGRKAMDDYANLKSNNYLVYLMGAAWAREERLNECLILNAAGRVADASISNVFCVAGGRIHTPPLSEGGVAGVLRRFLLERLEGWGWPVAETPLEPADLEGASEIFLTNAIRGIRWVKQFRERQYDHDISAGVCQCLEQCLE
jgi:branched-chain amino acid aminotransferase